MGPRSYGFAELVREHQGPLRSFLRRICWSFDEADDLAQETFISAWQQLDSYRGDAAFRSWLFGIAYRKALASQRSRSRASAREAEWQERGAPAAQPQPELRIDLQKALRSLSESQLAVVALFWGSAFSQEEIARTLGLPLGTVKSHINRARERIRAYMEGSDGSD